MTKWNYRIVQITDMDMRGVEYSYIIARVRYNDKGEPLAYLANISPVCQSEDELGTEWNAIADAFNQATLTEEDFVAPTEAEMKAYGVGE